MRKYLIPVFVILLLVAAYFYFSTSPEIVNEETHTQEKKSKREIVFNSLAKKKADTPKIIKTEKTPSIEPQSFQEVQTSLKESTQKCRSKIDELLPGEEKTEEIPDSPEILEKILNAYLDSKYGENVYKINSYIAGQKVEKDELKNFITKQEESQQCYPFVEQEILLKMLDEITEDDIDPNLKEKYKTLTLSYIGKALEHPQSLFHLASYLNIIQVFAENNLVDNRSQFELDRIRNEIMTTVRETDEDLIKSLRNNEMSNFVDVHKRRYETTDKAKNDTLTVVKEMNPVE